MFIFRKMVEQAEQYIHSYYPDLFGDVTILSHDEAEREFRSRFRNMMKPTAFNIKQRILLFLLIQSNRYQTLTAEEMAGILSFSVSTVWRARNTEFKENLHKTTKKGRPPKLTIAIVDELLRIATEERNNGTPLSLKWFKEKINEISSVPLVLHGGSGIPKEVIWEAKKYGLIKINYGSDLRKEFIRTFGEAYEANHNEHDVIHLSLAAVKNVSAKAKELVMMINEN